MVRKRNRRSGKRTEREKERRNYYVHAGRKNERKERKKEMEVRAAQKRRVGGCGGNRGRLSEVRFQCTTQREGTREEVRGWRGRRLGAPFEGGLLNFQGHSRGPPLVRPTEKEKGRKRKGESTVPGRESERNRESQMDRKKERQKEKDRQTQVETRGTKRCRKTRKRKNAREGEDEPPQHENSLLKPSLTTRPLGRDSTTDPSGQFVFSGPLLLSSLGQIESRATGICIHGGSFDIVHESIRNQFSELRKDRSSRAHQP